MLPSERKDKDDDDYDYIPFQGLEKGAVLQERRIFNDTTLNPRKCCLLLTKLLYLITNGETFTTQEATAVFFAVTKLFQSNDIVLRRMTYLVLKELIPFSEDVIIVISSLTKDMNNPSDIYRANSIRVLCRTLSDLAMLGQGERYLKQAIVDKEPYVASSALVSGYHLMVNPGNGDIVKRWFNEIQESTKSKHVMVQYHALGLLYKIRQHDKLAVSKIVVSMTKASIRSPFAHCLLIRLAKDVLTDDPENKGLFDYLESCLRHKSTMVNLEAAQAICSLPNMNAKTLIPAISQLQVLLCSTRTVKRFAAIRCLNKIALTHPAAVSVCNLDIENLIGGNRSIATLAITTLLKTGSESSVDRLMRQIQSFMGEISDDFKVTVVDAIRVLCIKFPKKQHALLGFLSGALRNEGGVAFKTAIVDAIFEILKYIPQAKDAALNHLCEFIEDCEFVTLCSRILHELGEEGPTTQNPAKFIRYIYNRVLLEPAIVRASAVSALGKFGRRVPQLRPRVIIILRRCLVDLEEEVRDKAAFHLNLLERDAQLAQSLLESEFPVPLPNLEGALQDYLKKPSAAPFDIGRVSTEAPKEETPKGKKSGEAKTPDRTASAGGSASGAAASSSYAEQLAQVPQLGALGPLFRSTRPQELTESETEYTVNCVKHIFAQHIVFQFNVNNTLNDQLLEDVTVKMEPESEDFVIQQEIPCASLPYNVVGVTYVVVARSE